MLSVHVTSRNQLFKNLSAVRAVYSVINTFLGHQLSVGVEGPHLISENYHIKIKKRKEASVESNYEIFIF